MRRFLAPAGGLVAAALLLLACGEEEAAGPAARTLGTAPGPTPERTRGVLGSTNLGVVCAADAEVRLDIPPAENYGAPQVGTVVEVLEGGGVEVGEQVFGILIPGPIPPGVGSVGVSRRSDGKLYVGLRGCLVDQGLVETLPGDLNCFADARVEVSMAAASDPQGAGRTATVIGVVLGRGVTVGEKIIGIQISEAEPAEGSLTVWRDDGGNLRAGFRSCVPINSLPSGPGQSRYALTPAAWRISKTTHVGARYASPLRRVTSGPPPPPA